MNTNELRKMYARVDAERPVAPATTLPWMVLVALAALAAAAGWVLA